MINRQTAVPVLVHEDEGRARHFRAALQTCHEAFHKLRFPGAEISGQGEDIALARDPRVTAPRRDGLLHAI